ncbi:MAG: hypothetical protein AAF456_17035 [Planctomycetota bacterium]
MSASSHAGDIQKRVRTTHVVVAALAFITLCFSIPRNCFGQYHRTFDSGTNAFQLFKTDCDGPEKTWTQKRTTDAETGESYEQIHFESGIGSSILLAADIPAGFVIPELKIGVRINASQPGVRLLARVVLPETPAPDGSGPLKITIPGDSYTDAGRWQTLSVEQDSNLEIKLREQAWLLRQQHSLRVNTQNAYIDKLVLDAYTVPGALNLMIDDITVDGIVAADRLSESIRRGVPASTLVRPRASSRTIQDSQVQPAGYAVAAPAQERQPSIVVRDGTVLLVRGVPFFPKLVQHNGEPFNFLKSLGFNTIELSSTATTEQLRRADDLDIWIVCPPPPSTGLSPIGFEYDRVLAWSLGHGLTGRDLQLTQQRVREIRQSDLREGRPIVAGVDSQWKLFGQEVDVLSTGLEPLGTSFIASRYSDWLIGRSESTSNTRPIWATIQTEPAPSLTRQISAVSQPVPPIPVEPQQMKFLTYEAISGGSRGLRFSSRNRLDAPDPVTRLRAMTIKWTLRHVEQIEPWAVGGALMGQLELQNNHLEVTALNTNRSRLLLVQRTTHHEQYWAGDTPLESVAFRDNESTFTGQAYLLSDDGLIPVPGLRNYGGAELNIDSCPYCVAVVMTEDPTVINRLRQSYLNQVGRETLLQLRVEITRQWMAIMQLIDNQMGRMGRSPAMASSAINEAINAWRKASELLTGSSPASSMEFLNRADERLALARREFMTQPLGRFKSKTSTPFLTHVSLIPLHWQVSERLGGSSWNPNGLAGGDFENLDHMMRNGWENHRLATRELNSNVELSQLAAVDGKYGLKLTVTPTDRFRGIVQSDPVWITTGNVSVRTGQMVRIHGWINVPETITGSYDGLMITESIGGEQLAERISLTHGWQELTLYRTAPADGDLSVKIALTGVGTAYVDELTVRTIDLPPSERQAQR